MPSATVRVSNLSFESTEESVQDYFSFCGDIQLVKVVDSEDGRSKEAEIVFDSEAAASTAVLLNNALVEGRNILVEMSGDAGASKVAPNEAYSTSQASLNSTTKSTVLSDIVSEAKSVASQVTSATKDLNAKYDVTGKLKNAYSTAATTTSNTFEKLDQQYNIRGNTSKAYEATKTGLSSMYRQVSGFWNASTSSGTSGEKSPNVSSNGSAPHSDIQ